jgi:methionine aminopeptidase
MNSLYIKTPEQLELMAESGRLPASVFTWLDDHVKPASKGQYGFQYVLNTSVNDVVCHGIPSSSQQLKSGDIGHAIQSYAEAQGYSVVREYCGHGIGRQMHEAPQVLHYGRPGKGLVLKAGMTFTIEPMINQGRASVKEKRDGWTVVTADKKLSAQWEHTIAVTNDGYRVLTLREEEKAALK